MENSSLRPNYHILTKKCSDRHQPCFCIINASNKFAIIRRQIWSNLRHPQFDTASQPTFNYLPNSFYFCTIIIYYHSVRLASQRQILLWQTPIAKYPSMAYIECSSCQIIFIILFSFWVAGCWNWQGQCYAYGHTHSTYNDNLIANYCESHLHEHVS